MFEAQDTPRTDELREDEDAVPACLQLWQHHLQHVQLLAGIDKAGVSLGVADAMRLDLGRDQVRMTAGLAKLHETAGILGQGLEDSKLGLRTCCCCEEGGRSVYTLSETRAYLQALLRRLGLRSGGRLKETRDGLDVALENVLVDLRSVSTGIKASQWLKFTLFCSGRKESRTIMELSGGRSSTISFVRRRK